MNAKYDRGLFKAKLEEMKQYGEAAKAIFEHLPASFTPEEMGLAIQAVRAGSTFAHADMDDTVIHIKWLTESNYEIFFPHGQLISERVIFPVSQNESNGVEDARFVRFVDEDGVATYYATYTAYNGREILPQMIETKDFHRFKISTLNGAMARNKGMALFPRRINGQYAMITRSDGENLYLSYSDNIHFWHEGVKIEAPENPWELVQIGNCGSPIGNRKRLAAADTRRGANAQILHRRFAFGPERSRQNDRATGNTAAGAAGRRARRLCAERGLQLRLHHPQRRIDHPLRHFRFAIACGQHPGGRTARKTSKAALILPCKGG